ncbi:MAG: serine/threonine-protein kinase [Pseudonocardia sp.]
METGELIAGRYRLRELIGAGGMGVVWRATDEELDRTVAVKQVLLGAAATPTDGRLAVERLRREARIAARLRHPRAVTLYDVAEDGDQPWLVMEYVRSRNLTELIAEQGPLTPQRTAQIGAQIADALAAAHAAGIVHRDVTPRNVLVTDDGIAKLADFGISRAVGDVTLTGSGPIAGTLAFLAPEIAGGKTAATASDVFSLGATLYAAVEGESPWGSTDDVLRVIRRATKGDVPPPAQAGTLTPVLTAMLRRRPADRPSAAKVERLLSDVCAGRRVKRPHRRTAAIVATAGALAITAGLMVVVADDQGDDPAATAQGGQRPGVGDTRTADPCALVDTEPLARFGETILETDYGNFNRCDVIVRSMGGGQVDVRVQLDVPKVDGPPFGELENRGEILIARQGLLDKACTSTLRLPDGNDVGIRATLQKGASPDVCAMADAATDSALAVLDRGEIPRRPMPFTAASLAGVDACRLLDAAALALVPRLGAAAPEPAFGSWECRWASPDDDAGVHIYFDRDQDLDDEDGEPMRIGGRPGAVLPDGGGECDVTVVHRSYADRNGDPLAELMHMEARSPAADPCRLAVEVATAVVAKLPPPS